MTAPEPEGLRAAVRVARTLRHMAELMLHGTEVPDDGLRSKVDGWAGALHGVANLLAASEADRAGIHDVCEEHANVIADQRNAAIRHGRMPDPDDNHTCDGRCKYPMMCASEADRATAGEHVITNGTYGWECSCGFVSSYSAPWATLQQDHLAAALPATPPADDTPDATTLRVTVTVDTDELRRWAVWHADRDHHGVAHVLFKAAGDGEGLDDQALREARAEGAETERQAWSSWLDNWMSAVGPEPPTVEAVATWLRTDRRPFGAVASGGTHIPYDERNYR